MVPQWARIGRIHACPGTTWGSRVAHSPDHNGTAESPFRHVAPHLESPLGWPPAGSSHLSGKWEQEHRALSLVRIISSLLLVAREVAQHASARNCNSAEWQFPSSSHQPPSQLCMQPQTHARTSSHVHAATYLHTYIKPSPISYPNHFRVTYTRCSAN